MYLYNPKYLYTVKNLTEMTVIKLKQIRKEERKNREKQKDRK